MLHIDSRYELPKQIHLQKNGKMLKISFLA